MKTGGAEGLSQFKQVKGLIPNENSEPFIWTLKIEYTGR